MEKFTGASMVLGIEEGQRQYSLRFGEGPYDYASCLYTETISSLIEQYVGIQTFDIIIMQDGKELGRGVYACLDANSHWLRMVREAGQAVGLIEKIATPLGSGVFLPKMKEIDPDLEHRSVAERYYQDLVFATPATEAERQAIQLEIREMDEQAKTLGLCFRWITGQEYLLEEIEDEEED